MKPRKKRPEGVLVKKYANGGGWPPGGEDPMEMIAKMQQAAQVRALNAYIDQERAKKVQVGEPIPYSPGEIRPAPDPVDRNMLQRVLGYGATMAADPFGAMKYAMDPSTTPLLETTLEKYRGDMRGMQTPMGSVIGLNPFSFRAYLGEQAHEKQLGRPNMYDDMVQNHPLDLLAMLYGRGSMRLARNMPVLNRVTGQMDYGTRTLYPNLGLQAILNRTRAQRPFRGDVTTPPLLPAAERTVDQGANVVRPIRPAEAWGAEPRATPGVPYQTAGRRSASAVVDESLNPVEYTQPLRPIVKSVLGQPRLQGDWSTPVVGRANQLLAEWYKDPSKAPFEIKRLPGQLGLRDTGAGMVATTYRAPQAEAARDLGFMELEAGKPISYGGETIAPVVREGDFPFEKIQDTPAFDKFAGTGASGMYTQALNQAIKEAGGRLLSSDSHTELGAARYENLERKGIVDPIAPQATIALEEGMNPIWVAEDLGLNVEEILNNHLAGSSLSPQERVRDYVEQYMESGQARTDGAFGDVDFPDLDRQWIFKYVDYQSPSSGLLPSDVYAQGQQAVRDYITARKDLFATPEMQSRQANVIADNLTRMYNELKSYATPGRMTPEMAQEWNRLSGAVVNGQVNPNSPLVQDLVNKNLQHVRDLQVDVGSAQAPLGFGDVSVKEIADMKDKLEQYGNEIQRYEDELKQLAGKTDRASVQRQIELDAKINDLEIEYAKVDDVFSQIGVGQPRKAQYNPRYPGKPEMAVQGEYLESPRRARTVAEHEFQHAIQEVPYEEMFPKLSQHPRYMDAFELSLADWDVLESQMAKDLQLRPVQVPQGQLGTGDQRFMWQKAKDYYDAPKLAFETGRERKPFLGEAKAQLVETGIIPNLDAKVTKADVMNFYDNYYAPEKLRTMGNQPIMDHPESLRFFELYPPDVGNNAQKIAEFMNRMSAIVIGLGAAGAAAAAPSDDYKFKVLKKPSNAQIKQ